VDYEPLPAVVSPEAALHGGAPLVHPDLGSNLAAHVEGCVGDVDAAFRVADHITRVRLALARQSPQPIEPRGVVADWDPHRDTLTVWDSTQSAHMVRRLLAYLLNLDEARIRVIVPDVRGGFGGKNRFYPEEFLAPFLAIRHRRPVQWLADRREDLLAMYLGVKGAGEGGIIPVAPAICGAVDQALAPWHVFCCRIPLTPERVLAQCTHRRALDDVRPKA